MPLTDFVIMPSADYTAACDKIRKKSGKTDPIKSGDLANEIDAMGGGEPYNGEYERLQGTWIFDKVKVIRTPDGGHGSRTWQVNFTSNGLNFNSLVIDSEDFPILDTNSTWAIAYGGDTGVYYIHPSYATDPAYATITITSKYDEVENADTLVQALSGRATHIPITDGNIIIPMTSTRGVRLLTAGKLPEKDIVVIPELEEVTITANDTYTPSKVGYSKVIVNVEASGSDAFIEGYEEVNLPNATKIKNYGFYNDTIMTDITMLNVASIGNFAFQKCSNLVNVDAPKVTSIGNYAFNDCSKLANIVMPQVTSIGARAFWRCSNLALTSLPSGVTTIPSYAFAGCTKLALTSLPSGVTSIADNAFNACSNLALTSLPSGLTSIEYATFYNCQKLALTSLPSGITSIAEYGLSGCTNLTTITFEGTPTSIASNAFSNCSNLKTINVPWAEGAVANAPWGATNATINYNYTGG